MRRVDRHLRFLLRQWAASQRARLILWSPLPLMAGIATYFTLTDEPPAWLGAAALIAAGATLVCAWQRPQRLWLAPVFLMALGFFAAQGRAHLVATPLLTEELHDRVVEGTIDEIEPVEQREKLVLSHLAIEGLPAEKTPLRVRVSFRNGDAPLHVGDRVRMTANLYPLPMPVMPGSYDFARHFYFRSIGGNGFAFHIPDVVDANGQSGIAMRINDMRHSIGEDMRAHIPGAAGTVAAAMTVGETGPIPDDVKTVLRDSGLAHMLAIAGLHLGIVTGIVFFNLRLLLTLWPALALRLPVKKMAAAGALASAFIYLVLAGFPIPAQRAFIMVSFLFAAVLIDRRGITLRTLVIAAVLILLAFPESMFGASFQMSFAATLAIVSLYEHFGQRLHPAGRTWRGQVWRHVLGIAATSIVATLATAPFVLYHFNRFALFGLLANMIVIPLATFLIMPGMVLALLLMPVGLQFIGYVPLYYGVTWMIAMAQWVTSLPYASLHLPSPADGGLALAAFGLLWLCLTVGRTRMAGVPMIAAGLATLALHVPVDVFISGDAKQVMVRLDDGHYTALKGTARAFTVQNWLRAEGEDALVPLKETDMRCDKAVCTYSHGGHHFIMVKTPEDDDALDDACSQNADVLVAWRYLHNARCRGPARLIGRAELEAHGPQALWLREDGVHVAYARDGGQGQRLWQPPLNADFPDDP